MNLLKSIIYLVLVFNLYSLPVTFSFRPPNSGDAIDEGSVDEAAVSHDVWYAPATDDSVFIAVRRGDLSSVRRMINRGIDLNNRDSIGWTPLDYARKNNRQEIRKLLQESGAVTFPKSIPDMCDGPHVKLIDSSVAEVFYLKHDAKSGRSGISSDTFRLDDLPMVINGVSVRREDFGLENNFSGPVSSFKCHGKIFVIGDMHGVCSRTVELLKKKGITDSEGNWNWGKGHLVFIGDIFDRGTEMTEALWMIFRFEKQAAEHGGMVPLILGNHEPMIFYSDLRYVDDDYYSLCDNLNLSYSDLFDNKSLLGIWLRQKPAVIRINNYVFVHAGFSPELIDREVPADTINYIVWRYLNNIEYDKDRALRQLIMGGSGVVWYRGMIDEDTRKDVIEKSYVARCLNFYKSDALIIGHTEVDTIKYYFDGRVIDVDIPKRELIIPEQGLLIKKHTFRINFQDGTSKKLIRLSRFRDFD